MTFYFFGNTAHIFWAPAYLTDNLAEDFARGDRHEPTCRRGQNLKFRHLFVAGRIRNTVDVMVKQMVKVGYETLLFKLAVLQVHLSHVSMQCMRSAILFYRFRLSVSVRPLNAGTVSKKTDIS